MNPDHFARLLYQGRGLPYLILRDQPTDQYNSVLLNACLYNPVYNPQCEPDRAEYYHAIISQTPDPAWFEQQIVDALNDPDDEMDLDLLCDFALIYAKHGNVHARRLLYEICNEYAALGETIGARQIVTLDGVAGILHAANQLGQAVMLDPECVLFDFLYDQLQEHVTISVSDLCSQAGKHYPFVQHYFAHLDRLAQQQDQKPRLNVDDQPFAVIQAQIDDLPLTQCRRWMRQAHDDDVLLAAHALLQATDSAQIKAYLMMFTLRRFPLDFHHLMSFLRHDDEWVVDRALEALAYFEHETLRDLAIEFAQTDHVRYGLLLLVLNFQPADVQWLKNLYQQATDDERKHDMSFAIREIVAEHFMPETIPLLELDFVAGVCSLCRGGVVALLQEHDAFASSLAAEYAFDVNAY